MRISCHRGTAPRGRRKIADKMCGKDSSQSNVCLPRVLLTAVLWLAAGGEQDVRLYNGHDVPAAGPSSVRSARKFGAARYFGRRKRRPYFRLAPDFRVKQSILSGIPDIPDVSGPDIACDAPATHLDLGRVQNSTLWSAIFRPTLARPLGIFPHLDREPVTERLANRAAGTCSDADLKRRFQICVRLSRWNR